MPTTEVPASVPVPPSDALGRAQIRCPRPECRRVMAETDGRRLYLASCLMLRVVTLHCIAPACDGRVYWEPKRR